jgi:hypothetical protein
MTIQEMVRQTYWAEWHEFHISEQKGTEIIPRLPSLLDWLYEEIQEESFQYWDSSTETCQDYANCYGVSFQPGEVFYVDDANEQIADTMIAYGWWHGNYERRVEGSMCYDYRQEIKDGIIHSILGRLNREREMKSVA